MSDLRQFVSETRKQLITKKVPCVDIATLCDTIELLNLALEEIIDSDKNHIQAAQHIAEKILMRINEIVSRGGSGP